MCLAPNVDTGDPHCQIKFATQKHTFFLPYFSFSRPLNLHHRIQKPCLVTRVIIGLETISICLTHLRNLPPPPNRQANPPIRRERIRWHYRLLSLILSKTYNWFSLDQRPQNNRIDLSRTKVKSRPQTVFSTLWLNWWLGDSDNDQDPLSLRLSERPHTPHHSYT